MIIYKNKVLPGINQPDIVFNGYQVPNSLKEYSNLTIDSLQKIRNLITSSDPNAKSYLNVPEDYLIVAFAQYFDDEKFIDGVSITLPDGEITYGKDVNEAVSRVWIPFFT